MKKISKKEMFENKLRFYIPRLSDFKLSRGSEGKAYFIDKEYVIKEFADRNIELIFFERYCKEIKRFSYMGLSVPKVYAWVSIPTFSGSGKKSNIFYVLEEQVKGDVLYEPTLSSVYTKCEGFCSFDEFNIAIKNKLSNLSLFEKILETFFNRFITENAKLEAMPKAETIKFLESFYLMKKKSVYSFPDFNPGNIILSDRHIKLIDNGLCGEARVKDDLNNIKYQVFEEILDLFYENNNLQDFFEIYLEDTALSDNKVLREMLESNKRIFEAVLNRWVNIMLEIVGEFKLGENDFNYLSNQAVNLLGKEKGTKLSEQFERDF